MTTHLPLTTLDPFLAPIFGGDRGYATEGDVLVNQTADGIDLNVIYSEISQVLGLYNSERSRLASLLSYGTTAIADAVPQSIGSESFEEASEFGVPQGVREGAEALLLGYTLSDWDLASRWTWQFLRDAREEQVRSVATRIIEADNKLVNTTILERLFNPTELLSPEKHRVFGLWNGTDGMTPPPHAGITFPSADSHYLASGSALVDSADVEDLIAKVKSKGYGLQAGTQLLILANPVEGELIQAFKKGLESRPRIGAETTAPVAKYDFIPSASAPAYLTEENIVGQIAPAEYGSLPVAGSYGPSWLIESAFVPAGYIAVVASGGPNSERNPVAFRQHVNPAYQGLRMISGSVPAFPLQDSFFQRSFGTGVRHRGAAAVMQITPGFSYTAPTFNR
ncbi:hypothetical protein [Rhodococcus sp. IEGM 1318]|uniref:hypothetical protein n=1 Tax=Rhodococcus sp. IEGM 1318 TaxID=3082226 RepID=UPI002952ABF8|nr:hypothetical protein [Rhodococcus sp. IEGM 1318]MDV8008623.1 hypothetical protein [Rhodococcus sp. IEGM 1318]